MKCLVSFIIEEMLERFRAFYKKTMIKESNSQKWQK